MKKTLIRLLTISCLLAAGSLNSVAQEKKPRPDESRPQKPGPGELKVPTDGTFKILPPMAPKFAIGKVVKGTPYSATATTETVQTLSDGNQIIRKNESKLYRDSEGRTRIEQTLGTIGKWTADGEAQQHIFINDPVMGSNYSLDPRTRTAIKEDVALAMMYEKLAVLQKYEDWRKEKAPIAKTMKTIELMEEMEKQKQEKLKAAEKQSKLKEGANTDDASGRRKTESLGKRMIEGVEAEGTRVTITIPAGEIGNTLPIEVVDETWQAPELQLVVMSKHHDPRSGETTYRLTNIDRSEPDRSLFEVPADYTVTLGKMPPKKKSTKEEE